MEITGFNNFCKTENIQMWAVRKSRKASNKTLRKLQVKYKADYTDIY